MVLKHERYHVVTNFLGHVFSPSTLLNRLPLESKGKNFVTFVCGIRLLNLEEKCPLREDLPLHFRENFLQEVKVPLPMEEFASNC